MVYPMPPATNEKEKILGGLFTLAQTAWLAGGIVLGGIMFMLFGKVLNMGMSALIVAIPFLFSGTPFAFYRKYDMSLFDYIRRKQQFKGLTKKLPNYRKESE